MKKVISMIVVVTYLSCASVAFAYKAECMQDDGKFTDCKVDVTDGVLNVAYGKKKWRSLDRSIPGDRITALSGGEYARRRVGESIGSAVLLGPLFLFMLFSKKKRDNFGVEFMNDEGKKEAVLFQTKKKYGFALGQQLRTISGHEIVMQGEEKKAGEGDAATEAAVETTAQEIAANPEGVVASDTNGTETEIVVENAGTPEAGGAEESPAVDPSQPATIPSPL